MKTKLIDTLNQWINQRPGLDPRNYISDYRDTNGIKAYRDEARSITKDLHHARALIRYVQNRDSITTADIVEATRGKRLHIQEAAEGYQIDYTTGQYFPTEYRRAAASVLASAIWDRLRLDGAGTRDDIYRAAKRELGAPIANRFFK
jgi:hypothetical protein